MPNPLGVVRNIFTSAWVTEDQESVYRSKNHIPPPPRRWHVALPTICQNLLHTHPFWLPLPFCIYFILLIPISPLPVSFLLFPKRFPFFSLPHFPIFSPKLHQLTFPPPRGWRGTVFTNIRIPAEDPLGNAPNTPPEPNLSSLSYKNFLICWDDEKYPRKSCQPTGIK